MSFFKQEEQYYIVEILLQVRVQNIAIKNILTVLEVKVPCTIMVEVEQFTIYSAGRLKNHVFFIGISLSIILQILPYFLDLIVI